VPNEMGNVITLTGSILITPGFYPKPNAHSMCAQESSLLNTVFTKD
jgi:hypothetical protein